MTEQVLSSPAVQQEPTTVESSTSTHSGNEVSHQPAEKQIAQSDVGKIAGAIRKESHDKGYEKGYQDALSKFQQQQAANAPTLTSATEQHSSHQQSQAPSEAHIQGMIQQKIAEALEKQQSEQKRVAEEARLNEYVTQLGNQLRPKIEAAKTKFEDFDSTIQDLQLYKIPHLLEWVNSVPNAGEVLYDLAKNPHKLGILNSIHTPELAIRQIHAISQSLQNNQTAQDKGLPRNPVSSVQPSNVGKNNAGELTGQALTDQARTKYRF